MRRFCIITLLICSCVGVCGCETQQQKEHKALKDKERSTESQKYINELDFRREAVLLSLRYKIEEEKIFNLLVEEGHTDTFEDPLSPNKNTRKRIEEYSEKYGIPQDVIASIFIDYRDVLDGIRE